MYDNKSITDQTPNVHAEHFFNSSDALQIWSNAQIYQMCLTRIHRRLEMTVKVRKETRHCSDLQISPAHSTIQKYGPCEEVTNTDGCDLFQLKKQNKRNFNDIVLNMISKQ